MIPFLACLLVTLLFIGVADLVQGDRQVVFLAMRVLSVPRACWTGYVTAMAVSRYMDGEPGGIKMGVDLEGGTILVYEIDLKKREGGKDDVSKTNLLAESLKRRIDPNDLKNIVIRPAGEGRVEIILPTGGVWRTQKAEEAWNELKKDMAKKYLGSESDASKLDRRSRQSRSAGRQDSAAQVAGNLGQDVLRPESLEEAAGAVLRHQAGRGRMAWFAAHQGVPGQAGCHQAGRHQDADRGAADRPCANSIRPCWFPRPS